VLGFGGDAYGRSSSTEEHYQHANSQIGRFGRSLARELRIGPGLAPALERAVRNDLVPRALEAEMHEVIGIGTVASIQARALSVTAFLETSARETIAGRFRRQGGLAECWILPEYATPATWSSVAIGEWRPLSPDRFPRAWVDDVRWLTLDEENLVAEREGLELERQLTAADFDRRELELEVHRREAGDRAAARERRLLIAQGDELVDAVGQTLQSFGFAVRNMDLELPERDRREDLRISAPDRPGWEAPGEGGPPPTSAQRRAPEVRRSGRVHHRGRDRYEAWLQRRAYGPDGAARSRAGPRVCETSAARLRRRRR